MWAFVGKKQKNCDPLDPADDHKGEYWDHVALDPEHRLVLAVVPSARSMENAEEVVAAVEQRLGEQPPRLITSDEHPAYATAIETVPDPRGAPNSGGVGLCDGPQGAGAEPCRCRPTDAGAGGPEAVGQRAGGLDGQRYDHHVVRRAASWDGSRPQRAEGAENEPVQQGLAGTRGDDLLHQVQRQLLLGGPDAPAEGRRRPVAAPDSGDGRGSGGPRLVPAGLVELPGRSIIVGHHPTSRQGPGQMNLNPCRSVKVQKA